MFQEWLAYNEMIFGCKALLQIMDILDEEGIDYLLKLEDDSFLSLTIDI